uniref:5'-nucleotidase, C-terminal domain n=1 Tax=Candidatus Kentrum sp. LFY TaxID=2126342 RepID=A0A450UU56_9GAMM|nr:MAG: 5'-nucleotidase, C-terminal domain [Candidatus Kentron sp. LFY]
MKGGGFRPHVNPLDASVLRTPIDTIIGFTKVPLHRSNFSDTEGGIPAVIEGSSHDFLADAFRDACRGDVGVMRGFRYGTHIGPGAIELEDIYHFIPTGPQIACGEISGDALYLAVERSADRVFFSEDNPQLQAFDNLEKNYTQDDNVIFLLVPRDGRVFTRQTLMAVEQLTEMAWQIPYSIRVDSISNFQHTQARGDDPVVADLVRNAGGLRAMPGLPKFMTLPLQNPY